MASPPEKPAFRTLSTTLLTGLYLPREAPLPEGVPLPDGPVPNPELRLPAGGVSLLYGLGAPGLMGQALHRAQHQDWRAIGAQATAVFERVLAAGRLLAPGQLPEVQVLWLNKLYTGGAVAETVQRHLLRYLEEEGRVPPKLPKPQSFALAGQHPHLLRRLLDEPEFSHLRAAVALLPGVSDKGDPRPASQIMYVRDLSALRDVRVIYGAPPDVRVFRMPEAGELERPRAALNPFRAALPKPNVVYVRLGPVGPIR